MRHSQGLRLKTGTDDDFVINSCRIGQGGFDLSPDTSLLHGDS